MSDRPPKPPRRHCDYPGCDNPPQLPNKDWSTTCTEHAGVPRPVLAAQERASEPAGLDVEALQDFIDGVGVVLAGDEDIEWIRPRRKAAQKALARLASAAAHERPADAALREAVWIVARKSDGEAMAVYAVEQDAVEDVARRHRRHRDRYKVEAWQVLQPSPEPAEQPAEKGDSPDA